MEVDLDVTTAAVCDLQTFALCDRVVLLQHCNCRSTTAGCGGPAEDGHLDRFISAVIWSHPMDWKGILLEHFPQQIPGRLCH